MATGDEPIIKDLALNYAISDNYHQAVMGGTGANHIALGTGYAASFQNSKGMAVPPPPGEIENPNPKPGTNNNYTQDGYGSSTVANAGGSYSECANSKAPGVSTIDKFLGTLPYKPLANCQKGRYYLLNNYNAGYNLDGTVSTVGAPHHLGILRRGLRKRPNELLLLRHLRPDAVLVVDHDQPGAAQERAAWPERLRLGGGERHAAGGDVPQAR
jgi:hypothetical protein